MPFRFNLKLQICIAIAVLWMAGSAFGSEVTLALRTGGLTIIGELVASDAGSFVIKSDKFGVMAVESSKFDCSGAACPRLLASQVAIHGSNTIGAQLMPNTIERFADKEGYTLEKVVGADPEQIVYKLYGPDNKDAGSIDLQSHGSNTAPPDLKQGKAQIGEMSRPIKPEEVKALADSGIELQTHIFALDGVIVFVSPKNPIRSLSLEQIARIFAGETRDWSELGRSPGKIKLYARDDKSGTFDTFDNLVLRPMKLKLSPEAKRFESSPDLSDETARDPDGIGFAGFAYARNARPLTISSACGIVSAPEVFSVKTEEYPLSRRLYLYTTASLSPLGNRLLDFALSDKVQDSIAEVGFINQRIELQGFEQQTGRLAPALLVPDAEFKYAYMRDLVNDLRNARRLSVNFRFQKNSAALDEKARQDVPRLARFLKSDAQNYKEILLLGFTDNTGSFDGNRVVALNRANGIKAALVAEGLPANQITAKAYGSLLPVGCNATETGKDRNRRVEVWLKE